MRGGGGCRVVGLSGSLGEVKGQHFAWNCEQKWGIIRRKETPWGEGRCVTFWLASVSLAKEEMRYSAGIERTRGLKRVEKCEILSARRYQEKRDALPRKVNGRNAHCRQQWSLVFPNFWKVKGVYRFVSDANRCFCAPVTPQAAGVTAFTLRADIDNTSGTSELLQCSSSVSPGREGPNNSYSSLRRADNTPSSFPQLTELCVTLSQSYTLAWTQNSKEIRRDPRKVKLWEIQSLMKIHNLAQGPSSSSAWWELRH